MSTYSQNHAYVGYQIPSATDPTYQSAFHPVPRKIAQEELPLLLHTALTELRYLKFHYVRLASRQYAYTERDDLRAEAQQILLRMDALYARGMRLQHRGTLYDYFARSQAVVRAVYTGFQIADYDLVALNGLVYDTWAIFTHTYPNYSFA